jgi:23S rRNA (uracil1939-C5)-methyltransferase
LPIARPVKIADLLPPLTIETLVNGGAGLARHDGRVVFIPHSAVGDVVVARVTRIKKSFLEAEICEIVKPATNRRQPLCRVAGECGGCQWQHLPYQEQLYWKDTLFRDTLVRRCHIGSSKVLPVLPAAQEWGYRSRIQIKCTLQNDTFVTGFYRTKSHEVVAIDHCPLIAEELNNLLSSLRELLAVSSYCADVTQIDLTIDDRNRCGAVIHYCGDELSALTDSLQLANLSAEILLKLPASRTLVPVVGNGIYQIEVGRPVIPLNYIAGSFAQINLDQNRVMVQKVLEYADLQGIETVLDLFCGMGNFSLPLARQSKTVIGVEASSNSIEMATENCRSNRIENATFYNRSAHGALTFFKQRGPVDLVVLDPPRSGAAGVINELLQLPVKKVIYVSCDPQTLARDLNILVTGGYELVSSQSFDMFPQTHHCESITVMEWGG